MIFPETVDWDDLVKLSKRLNLELGNLEKARGLFLAKAAGARKVIEGNPDLKALRERWQKELASKLCEAWWELALESRSLVGGVR